MKKKKIMETATLALGFLKLSLGNDDEDVLQHQGFLTFFGD